MAANAKKFKSSGWFRIATQGATTDGRKIERSWIEDMAATYDRSKYAARIWLEHYRGVTADSPFRAYGDVIAVKAEEVDVDGEKRLALFAQIEPTADLVAMNKAKQKLYTSIEIDPRFADTGRAYLTGLAVTDSPASLGTEALQFSAQNPAHSPFAGRKSNAELLFSEAVEVALQFEEIDDKPSLGEQMFSRVKDLLKLGQAKADGDFSKAAEAIELVAGEVGSLSEKVVELSAQGDKNTALAGELESLRKDFTDLQEALGKTQDFNQPNRPPATGGNTDKHLTDC
ncbi:GPO family capsid scaffolding protein [Pseudomonas sp. 21LCFQ010]|uniref:GPO family capsid scaffolding protein n=1 Tax=Pseudomonas sp. 21LCFQ010 TaxID=2957506 RepID=UPI00209693FE|nr:GPO family capsid scaffolding protein [Pseudomonas sp. 21LCFQ010]MCO8162002.1 GPO family capsid scaffolding protein [Pseudomonas sp. 21LCFQ010]